jgi:hypothetical protein
MVGGSEHRIKPLGLTCPSSGLTMILRVEGTATPRTKVLKSSLMLV